MAMTENTQTQQDKPIETAADEALKNRRIRSFVLRQGRLTRGQARALETGLPQFGISYSPEIIDLNANLIVRKVKKYWKLASAWARPPLGLRRLCLIVIFLPLKYIPRSRCAT